MFGTTPSLPLDIALHRTKQNYRLPEYVENIKLKLSSIATNINIHSQEYKRKMKYDAEKKC